MGARKFYENNAAKLDALGVDSVAVVDAWRKLHAPIVRFWYAAEAAFKRAAAGHTATVSCFKYAPSDDGKDVAAFLPSGRPIVYNDVHIDAEGHCSYHGNRGREHVYGGLLVENLIQSLCRDLLADSLVRLEEAGLNPVMHVHDESVCEVDGGLGAEAYEYQHHLMTILPDWAAGFPIGAAGFHGRRYRK
jgi:DNA polymerase